MQRRNPTKSSLRKNAKPLKLPRLDLVWLKFLIVSGKNNEQIRAQLVADVLPDVTDVELDEYRHALAPTVQLEVGTTHLPSIVFLYKHNLRVFYDSDPRELDSLLGLLRSHGERELVETGVLAGVPPYAIKHVLRKHFGNENATDTTILNYRRTFFDIAAVPSTQLIALVEARVRQSVVHRVGVDAPQLTSHAVARDRRVIAATMPNRQLAWSATLIGLGLPPPYDMPAQLLVPYARA